MSNRLRHVTLAVTAVLLATGAGFLLANRIQKSVAVLPGIEGCLRLTDLGGRTDCLGEQFQRGADKASTARKSRQDDVIDYVRRVETLASRDTRLSGACHSGMHVLGRNEGGRAAKAGQVPRFPNAASQLCTAGFVHGLAEGYLEGTPVANVAAVFPKLCADKAAQSGCSHGVGHALLRGTSNAPRPRDALKAARRCDDVPSNARSDCDAGVFMELAMRPSASPIPVTDYVSTCNQVSGVERELSCWSYLGLSLLVNDVPPDDTPGWCAKAPYSAQFTCVEGYGRMLGVARLTGCEKVERLALRKRCVDGAIGLQVGSGHASRSAANAACRRLASRKVMRYCVDAVDRYSRGRAKVEQRS